MALTVDPATKVWSVLQADLSFIGGTLYDMDTDVIKRAMMVVLSSEDYVWMDDSFIHNTEVTVAGTTFARTIEVINSHSITLEDTSLAYSVRMINSNNNMFDIENSIMNPTPLVTVVSTNSAGLVVTGSAVLPGDVADIADAVWDEATADHVASGSFGLAIDLTQYLGSVWIDTANGSAGTVVGTNGLPTNPVDSLADAITLATSTGFRAFSIRKTSGGPLTLTGSLDDWTVNGVGEGVVIALAGQDVDGTLFRNVELSGAMNGRVAAFDCSLDGVSEMEGNFFRCELTGNCAMPTAGGAILHMEDCSSNVAGTTTPNLSVAGTAANDYHFRGYKGGIEIENSDHADTIGSLDLVAGQVILGATNTAGSVALRGVMDVTDTSGAGFTITRTAALNLVDIPDAIWDETASEHTTPGSFGDFVQNKLLTVAKWIGLK